MKLKIIIPIILVVAALGLNNPPLFKRLFNFTSPAFASQFSSPLSGKLSFSGKPILNKPVTLRFKFSSYAPEDNAVAKIELPDTFVLVSGNLEWQGSLAPGKEQSLEIIVKSTKVGYYQLRASVATSYEGTGTSFGAGDTIDIEITPNDAFLNSTPPNNWHDRFGETRGVPIAQNNQAINSELLISGSPELNKEFTVTYRVTSLIDLPIAEATYLFLSFPQRGFEIIDAQFPEGGQTFKYSGSLTWKGAIEKNRTVEISATFRITDVGQGFVYGHLYSPLGGGTFLDDVKIADLYVDKYKGTFTLKSLPNLTNPQ